MGLLSKTKKLCQKHEIKPERKRGQNFLTSSEIYDLIVESAEITSDDLVLEVGPGLGFLTERLARAAKQVVAVEFDERLAEITKKRMKDQGIRNVQVVSEDIMGVISNYQTPMTEQFQLQEFQKYKIVANLPYQITSKFLKYVLTRPDKPETMTLMLQKEVAERIISVPPRMSLLSTSVQLYSVPKLLFGVSKKDFWPEPKVDSAVIQLKAISGPAGKRSKQKVDDKDLFRLIRMGYSAKRKMLKNNLAAGLKLETKEVEKRIIQAGFNAKVRAQELSVADWLKLFVNFD
jgi:16S rRNA (adenine1518-N6/adenine1519-N6)-dimethyltransferase